MRKLWTTTFAMVGGGAALIVGSMIAGLGPIPLVSGALLLWSGIVKLVVLRIWRQTLGGEAAPGSTAAPLPDEGRGTRSR